MEVTEMIKGNLVPNITIFDAEGNIDQPKTEWHMRWMFQKGVGGLFMTGSYGAGPIMTVTERTEIYKMAKTVADEFNNIKLIAHVGDINTVNAVQLAKAAEEIGVDAIGAVPPYYYKFDESDVINYYKTIISAVKTPVYAYNNPATTRFTFTLDTVKRLQEIGLKGVKDSSMNTSFLTTVYYDAKINHKDFQVMIGTSTGWLPYYYMGVEGMIAGMNNYCPEIIVNMYNWTLSGETAKAERAYQLSMDLGKKLKFTDSTIVSHMALYARGFDAGYPRKPLRLLDLNGEKCQYMKSEIAKALDILETIKNS
jgi:dihydrodipicolinate synthase/N-acetylneuraminate lyase